MLETPTKTSYHVIIDSIGKASPAAAKIISDSIEIPMEAVCKLFYNTPAVMFNDIEEEFATETVKLMKQLGLEVSMIPGDEPLPANPQLVDIGIYIHEASLLPLVCEQVAEFIGCGKKEALQLLTQEPCVVLGNVSENTAVALQERVHAEVFASIPEAEKYSIEIETKDPLFLKQLQGTLKHYKVDMDVTKTKTIRDLEYRVSHDIWRKYQGAKILKIRNQGFERFEVVLDSVDKNNKDYRKALTEMVGMPDEIIDQVLDNLPVQLNPSVHTNHLEELMTNYKASGLNCSAHKNPVCQFNIKINNISDFDKTKDLLGQFFEKKKLPTKAREWTTPTRMGDLMSRFLSEQLEIIGCDVELLIAE